MATCDSVAGSKDRSMGRPLHPPWRPWLLRLVLLIAATAAYWPSFRGVFVFDDLEHIVKNQRLQYFWTFWPELAWNTRPTVFLTLWLNYQLGGLHVLGYHLLNFAVHCVAGLTLYCLVRRTLRLPPTDKRWGRWADPAAFVVALLWLVHPLQTQAVTYVIQRCESMMGMFYLLSLYSVLRASQSARPWKWCLAGVAAGWLGMGCKEVMATAPIVILLYDRVYLSSSWALVFRRRWAFYLALAPALAWLVVVVIHNMAVPPAGYAADLPPSPLEYLLSQPAIILHYLRLAVLPGDLCLDYRWPVAQGWREIVLPGLPVLAIFAASLLALVRWPRVGFLAFSFFLILAPTSSFNPIADLAVDHRMYLPLALLIVLGLLGFSAVARRFLRPRRRRILVYAASVAVLVTLWSWRTIVRNRLFTRADAVWQNVLDHAPDNFRACHNLGISLLAAGEPDRALPLFRRAIQLQPKAAEPYIGVMLVMLRKGDLPGAAAILRQGIAAAPASPMLHDELGLVLDRQGKTGEAAAQYRLALQCNPHWGPSHYRLGRLLQRRGDFDESIAHLQAALQIRPLDAPCSFWLALAYQRCGRFPQAIRQYQTTLELAPAIRQARRNLDLCRQGNPEGEMLPDELKAFQARLPRR